MERQAGYSLSGQHTTHQLSMMTHSRISEVRTYYRDTFKNLRRIGNAPGMAMCLRSLGEMALLSGLLDEARSFWERSLELLGKEELPEAALLTEWLEAVRDLVGGAVERP